jgi:hypothetical protein
MDFSLENSIAPSGYKDRGQGIKHYSKLQKVVFVIAALRELYSQASRKEHDTRKFHQNST